MSNNIYTTVFFPHDGTVVYTHKTKNKKLPNRIVVRKDGTIYRGGFIKFYEAYYPEVQKISTVPKEIRHFDHIYYGPYASDATTEVIDAIQRHIELIRKKSIPKIFKPKCSVEKFRELVKKRENTHLSTHIKEIIEEMTPEFIAKICAK